MKLFFLIITFLTATLSFSQAKVNYSLIDKKMAAIPSNLTTSTDSIAKYINANFKTENDKIRAAFYWTAANIAYDIDNMFVVNYEETQQDRITKTLKTKTGICVDYAVIFNEIANATGVKAVLISGYTKLNDRISNLSHAWSGARIDGKWYLFDPTWGSGYVNSTDNKYIRRTSYSFYKIAPELMINSHMPFDYLWQFLTYPITNQEFIEGAYGSDPTKEKFDFAKEIALLETLPKSKLYSESADRIQKNGMKNQFISQAYINAKNISNNAKAKENWEKQKEISTKISLIVKQLNSANKDLNTFINYRNRQFQPLVSDEEIKKKIQEPKDKLLVCKAEIEAINSNDVGNKTHFEELKESINQKIQLTDEHLQFVNLYLIKPKAVRKTMFYSVIKTTKKTN